ncbi:MAG: hypothetical protein AB7T49_11025 [Oligoflexales bacterium]
MEHQIFGDTPLPPDEINRLWSHGLHEEKLFYDRLNYFTAMQVGLLGVFAILYNKDPAIGAFLPLTVVALAFTLIWHMVQVRHWRYCLHVYTHLKKAVPEYRRTISDYAGGRIKDGLSISWPLAFIVPALFAVTWLALIGWLFHTR